MLAGWDDSTVVARVAAIEPGTPGFIEVGRAGWRAAARTKGLQAAIELLDTMERAVQDDELRAALRSERVLAYMDSSRYDEAIQNAEALKANYGGTSWDAWATAAIYEIQKLRPGMDAPDFTVTARDRSRLTLSELRAPFVVLEFYRPTDVAYQREMTLRASLFDSIDLGNVDVVSVSLEEDPDLNSAFLDTRDIRGRHVVAEGGLGSEIARLYNVRVLPKRFLLHNRRIVGTYSGQAMGALIDDLRASLAAAS
jgi:peroxiredoxin